MTLIIAIVAAIAGSVVFAADVALVVVTKDNINSLFSDAGFSVQFGNGVWMVLVGVILTWVAVVVLSARACYCCGVRRYVCERWVLSVSGVDMGDDLVPRYSRLRRQRGWNYRAGVVGWGCMG